MWNFGGIRKGNRFLILIQFKLLILTFLNISQIIDQQKMLHHQKRESFSYPNPNSSFWFSNFYQCKNCSNNQAAKLFSLAITNNVSLQQNQIKSTLILSENQKTLKVPIHEIFLAWDAISHMNAFSVRYITISPPLTNFDFYIVKTFSWPNSFVRCWDLQICHQ